MTSNDKLIDAVSRVGIVRGRLEQVITQLYTVLGAGNHPSQSLVQRTSHMLVRNLPESDDISLTQHFREFFLYDEEIRQIYNNIRKSNANGLTAAETVDFVQDFWSKTVSQEEPVSLEWLSEWTEIMGTASFVSCEVFLTRFNVFFASRDNLEFQHKAAALGIVRDLEREKRIAVAPLYESKLTEILYGTLAQEIPASRTADRFITNAGLTVRSVRSFRADVIGGERKLSLAEAHSLWKEVYGNLELLRDQFLRSVVRFKKVEIHELFQKLAKKRLTNFQAVFDIVDRVGNFLNTIPTANSLGELLILCGEKEDEAYVTTGVFIWLLTADDAYFRIFIRLLLESELDLDNVEALGNSDKIRVYVISAHKQFPDFARLLPFLFEKFSGAPPPGRLADFWRTNFKSAEDFALEFCPFGVEALFYRFADDNRKLQLPDAVCLVSHLLQVDAESAMTAAQQLLEICGETFHTFLRMFGFWRLSRSEIFSFPCVHPENLVFLDDFRVYLDLMLWPHVAGAGVTKSRWINQRCGNLEFPVNADQLEIRSPNDISIRRSVSQTQRLLGKLYRELNSPVSGEAEFKTAAATFFRSVIPGASEELVAKWNRGVWPAVVMHSNEEYCTTRERLAAEFFTDAEIKTLWCSFTDGQPAISMEALADLSKALIEAELIQVEPEISLISLIQAVASDEEVYVTCDVFTTALQLWRVYLVGWSSRSESIYGKLWRKKFPGRVRITRKEYMDHMSLEISRNKNLVDRLFTTKDAAGTSVVLERRKFEKEFCDERELCSLFDFFASGVMEIEQLAMLVNSAAGESVSNLTLFLTLVDVKLNRRGTGEVIPLTAEEFSQVFPIWWLIR